jgi:hypothetical protein
VRRAGGGQPASCAVLPTESKMRSALAKSSSLRTAGGALRLNGSCEFTECAIRDEVLGHFILEDNL